MTAEEPLTSRITHFKEREEREEAEQDEEDLFSSSIKPDAFKVADQVLSSRSTNSLFTGAFGGGLIRQNGFNEYEEEIRSPLPTPGNAK